MLRHLANILLITYSTLSSQPFPISDEDEKRCDLRHSGECGNKERILQAHIRHPRRETADRARKSANVKIQKPDHG